MKIKKFNESLTKKDSPFTNWEMMEQLIAPIFKYDWTIYYKLYTMFDEDVMPLGPKHTKNFTDEFWKKFGFNIEEKSVAPSLKSLVSGSSENKPVVCGCIIDINDQIFNEIVNDAKSNNVKFLIIILNLNKNK